MGMVNKPPVLVAFATEERSHVEQLLLVLRPAPLPPGQAGSPQGGSRGRSWVEYMCHGQNMVQFPIGGDGHPTIDTDLETYFLQDSYCGMDDQKP